MNFRWNSSSLTKILFLTFTLAIFFTNCELQPSKPRNRLEKMEGGTGIGNPFSQMAAKLADSACETISRCHPEITYSQCSEIMQKTSGLDFQLGLPTGKFANYEAIISAEGKGTVVGAETAVQNCADIVKNLSCSSPQVQGAYIPEQTDPSWGLPRVFLQDACSQALSSATLEATEKFHYIRKSASGKGDGTDWNNACPGFVGSCAGNKMQRGHTYFVASGDYETVTFDVPGTDLITVKKATDVDHGTDVGWTNSFAAGPARFPSWVFRSSHWVLDGQSRSSLSSGHGFKIDLPKLNPNCSKSFCNGILLASETVIDRVTLRYIEIEGFGVNSNRSLNGVYSVPIEGSSSNITLFGVSLHDFGVFNGSSPLKFSGKGVVNLTFDESAIIRSRARAVSDNGSDNVTFRNSWFEDIDDQGVIVVGGPSESLNWLIYGNIFRESNPSQFGVDYGVIQCTNQTLCSQWQIVNNTFAGFTSTQTKYANINFLEAHPNSEQNFIYNNIWFNSNQPGIMGATLASDYNLYARVTAPYNDDYKNEPHGEFLQIDPFVSSPNADYHLRAPTSAGLVLFSPLTLGREGKVRGADGVWDRGAFEY